MAHLRSRRRLVLAVPVVLSLTASLGFLPGVASAAPLLSAVSAVSATGDGPNLAYVVNTETDQRTIASVKKAIAAAGGTVVITYDRIGVIVVHSASPGFGAQIRAVRGVQSAGATRTTPLVAAGTTDEGAADYLTAEEAAKVKAASPGLPHGPSRVVPCGTGQDATAGAVQYPAAHKSPFSQGSCRTRTAAPRGHRTRAAPTRRAPARPVDGERLLTWLVCRRPWGPGGGLPDGTARAGGGTRAWGYARAAARSGR